MNFEIFDLWAFIRKHHENHNKDVPGQFLLIHKFTLRIIFMSFLSKIRNRLNSGIFHKIQIIIFAIFILKWRFWLKNFSEFSLPIG